MMLDTDDIGPYEGLVRATAARYVYYLDEDLEDIMQILRLKVWQSLQRYDPSRSRMPVERYVFQNLRNKVKDLLKQQYRRNRARRSGTPIYTEDEAERTPELFERRYLRIEDEVIYAAVDEGDFRLPSTLTVFEVRVVHLLMLSFNQTEAARVLGVPRGRVRSAQENVREKMEDWRPTPPRPAALPSAEPACR